MQRRILCLPCGLHFHLSKGAALLLASNLASWLWAAFGLTKLDVHRRCHLCRIVTRGDGGLDATDKRATALVSSSQTSLGSGQSAIPSFSLKAGARSRTSTRESVSTRNPIAASLPDHQTLLRSAECRFPTNRVQRRPNTN